MKKTFDAVQYMRDRRRQIDEEDKGLTWEEKRHKTHEIVMCDPLLSALCAHALSPEQLRPLGRTR